ncbi:MAG: hypothetical protein CR974_01645 [Gammaproteobacteria bacterium]|nr:MAG: hypothetical protein CR974_01645 [Gammaproteobacteria bacterium]
MPTSKKTPKNNASWISLSLLFLSALFCGLWFNQASVENYWQQQYHQPSPLSGLQQYRWWRVGAQLRSRWGGESAEDDMAFSETATPPASEPAAPAAESITLATVEPSHFVQPVQPAAPVKPTPAVQSTVAKVKSVVSQPTPTDKPLAVETAARNDKVASVPPHKQTNNKPALASKKPVAGKKPTVSKKPTVGKKLAVDTRPAASTKPSIRIKPAIAKQLAQLQWCWRVVTATMSKKQRAACYRKKNHKAKPLSLDKVALASGDFVLIVGDSMAQALASPVAKWLKKNHNVNSLNMGRHSTGLTNQSYFDWPAKAEKSFKKYKKLRLVIVLMGANDPWSIVAGKKRLNFGSEAWAAQYQARMLRIVKAAHAQGAQVIWIGLPYMRGGKYNRKIRVLDSAMEKALAGRAIYLSSKNALSGGGKAYRDSIKINGKWRRVRGKDGIHITTQGNLQLLKLIRSRLAFVPKPAKPTKKTAQQPTAGQQVAVASH